MKHNFYQRILAFLLVAVMGVSLLPWSVFAQEALLTEGFLPAEQPIPEETPATKASNDTQATTLLSQIAALQEAAPIGQYYNHSVHKQASNTDMYNVKGNYFIVNVLEGSDGKQYAFALDPTVPAAYGHMAAIPKAPDTVPHQF